MERRERQMVGDAFGREAGTIGGDGCLCRKGGNRGGEQAEGKCKTGE